MPMSHRFVSTAVNALVRCLVTVSLWLILPVTGSALAATSKELCQQKVAGYALSNQIRDSATDPIRDVTASDRAKLTRVLNSQCLLNAEEMATHWNGKSEAERAAFFTNYTRINNTVTDAIFNNIFPNRQAAYTRAAFIKSAVAFPALCGEDNESDNTCQREFATLFAHWLQETSGLAYLTEGQCVSGGCASYLYDTSYFYNSKVNSASPPPDSQYWGRGPKQLSYNSNYGRFSWGYLGNMDFLERPSLLIASEWIDQSFVSAFWFYMTAVSQKPSMHEIVTGLWQPNAVDSGQGIVPGFGATIDVINGAVECGKPSPDTVKNRIAFYKGGTAQNSDTPGTLAAFGLQPLPNEVIDCEKLDPFVAGGAGSYPLYFNINPWQQCELYVNETLFTVYDQTHFRSMGNTLCYNGLDCCLKVRDKLKQEGREMPPLRLDDFVVWMGGTPTDVKAMPMSGAPEGTGITANGSDEPITVKVGTPIMLVLNFDAGHHLGEIGEWWLVAWSQDGWRRYDPNSHTWGAPQPNVPSESLIAPESSLPENTEVTLNSLPVGEYLIYFAAVSIGNDHQVPPNFSYDLVKVTITP
ncbi:MAG: chitinase [Pseudomonadota bacterium]